MKSEHWHTHDRAECRALLGDLSAYLDGEAEQALCEAIERHMAECEDCRVVVDTLAKTVNLYRKRGRTVMPGEAKLRLFRALDLEDYVRGGE
jgi:predicted anti-sigma-YlaC factor YlaD